MDRPLIGVTAGEIINKERPTAPIVYGQSHTYIDAVIASGGIPIILPITTDLSVITELVGQLDGLLLSGGNDIAAHRYDQTPSPNIGDTSDRRDDLEFHILSLALKQNVPILGICRGMQLLNVYLGGTLHQHIPDSIQTSINHDSGRVSADPYHEAHRMIIHGNTKLHGIIKHQDITVNSYHHQAVDKLGNSLRVSAYSPDDNIIEAIETDDERFIIGIQSHPESITKDVPPLKNLFDAFMDASNETRMTSSHQNSFGIPA